MTAWMRRYRHQVRHREDEGSACLSRSHSRGRVLDDNAAFDIDPEETSRLEIGLGMRFALIDLVASHRDIKRRVGHAGVVCDCFSDRVKQSPVRCRDQRSGNTR